MYNPQSLTVEQAHAVAPFALTTTAKAALHLADVLAKTRALTKEPELFSANDEDLSQEQALAIQSSVAQKLLATDGYTILNEMYEALSQMVEASMLFVLPVLMEEETLRTKLGEAFEDFDKGFQALREDLATVAELATTTFKRHKDLSGEVTDEVLTIITDCSLAYSKLQSEMENNISPELMNQMAKLESAGVGAEILQTALAKALQDPEEV